MSQRPKIINDELDEYPGDYNMSSKSSVSKPDTKSLMGVLEFPEISS
jgi:hypothetical protein